jgi:hypothetical protein
MPGTRIVASRSAAVRRLVALVVCASARAFAQPCELPAGGQVVANADATVRLAYRFEPPELKTDRHFTLLVDACSAATIDVLAIDAQMPEHRHGMNYMPVVTKIGANRWKADGLLLHMPGRWEFRFDLRTAGRTERLAHNVTVE